MDQPFADSNVMSLGVGCQVRFLWLLRECIRRGRLRVVLSGQSTFGCSG
jgi:hypothetical protein